MSEFPASPLLQSLYDARKEQDIRDEVARCEKSLAYFIRCGWPVLKPMEMYVHNWHIDAICEKLEAVSSGEVKRLQIWVPPGTMKTLIVSVFWPAWEWTRNPWLRYWTASYEVGLAGRMSAMSRDLMMSDWWRRRWGEMFKFTRDAESYFANSMGGTRLATAPQSTGSGEHGHRILIDDPINAKSADATSLVTLKETNEWYDGTVSTRGIGLNHARVIIMQRLHECLPPDTCVRTPSGSTPIGTLRRGDMVITSRGPQPVVEVSSRPHKGDIVNIRTYGSCEWFRATGNHRVLTVRGWVPSEEIRISDSIILAGPPEKEDVYPDWPPPRERLKVRSVQGSGVSGKKMPPRDTIQGLVDEGLSVKQIAERLGYRSRGSVHNALIYHGIERPAVREVPQEILRDTEFWWFVGLWLAEGCVTKNRKRRSHIRLTVHVSERHFLDRIENMLVKYGLTLHSRIIGNVIQASVHSEQVAVFLLRFGSRARNKFLPDWVNSIPMCALQELFHGYWSGDGSLSVTGSGTHLVRVGSSSIDLLEGWQRTLIKLGVASSLMRGGQEGDVVIDGEVKGRGGQNWELRFPLADARWLRPEIDARAPQRRGLSIEGGNLVLPVKSIALTPYDGMVWDIETPCHDFLVHSVTAHNSDLAAHVLDKDEWEVLCLPERYEPDHPFVWPNDPRSTDGELLWPEHRDEAASRALAASLTPHRAAGQLQQRPAAREGELLKTEWWRFYDPRIRAREDWGQLPNFSMIVQSLDCPQKDKETNDYIAIQLWGIHGSQRYLLDLRLERMNYGNAKRATKDMARWARTTWPKARHVILIENTGYGSDLIVDLRDELTGMTKINPQQDGDKEVRADRASDSPSSGHCFLPGYGPPWKPPTYDAANTPADVAAFIHNCARFPNATHDDDVDCFTQMINWLRKHQMRPLKTSSAMKSRRRRTTVP